MLSVLGFLSIVFSGYILSIFKSPFYGLLTYAFIYFLPPAPHINWWAKYLPFTSWSFLSIVILLISIFLHRDKIISERKLRSSIWAFLFVFTIILTYFTGVKHPNSSSASYILINFSIMIWIIIKTIKTEKEFHTYLFLIILMAGNLSIKAMSTGKRIHGRLENIGTIDTFGSNEFAILLGGIIPFLIPFIFHGKRYEKYTAIILTPFILNAFILCNSRGAFFALIAATVYTIFFIGNNEIKKKMTTFLIFGIPLLLYLADIHFMTRMESLLDTFSMWGNEEEMNRLSSGRFNIWEYGSQMVRDYPFGAGPDSFKFIARFYMPEEMLKIHPGFEFGLRAAHNTLLQVLVEHGFLGLFIWISMCGHTMLLLWNGSKIILKLELSNSFFGLTIVALNISFVTSLIGGMVNSRIYYEFFWWQIALAVVSYSLLLELEKKDAGKGLRNG